MSLCALNVNKDNCLPLETLKNIKDYIIEKNGYNESIINDKTNEKKIITILSDKLNCPDSDNNYQKKEICILKNTNSTDAEKALLTFFKPETSSLNYNYWINNSEIDSIQHQFQQLFKNYYYSNIHMIDLVMFEPEHIHLIDNTILSIKDINFINELKKENNKLTYNGDLKYYGIVINTDVSSGSGIHWFSIFMDFSKIPYTIEYFNSSGYDIKNINFKKFFINLADEISINVEKCKFIKVTDIQHQNEKTANCGAYSLYYIWKRLNGLDYTYFKKNKILDNQMEAFRKFLYRMK